MRDLAWRELWSDAGARYRPAGRYALHFARAKLRWDPVFRILIERGLLAGQTRMLDLGCGQGLLVALLCAARALADSGRWPAQWGQVPLVPTITGIEIARSDVARARRALGTHARFVQADIREAEFPSAGICVILDVLHYLPAQDQEAVLRRACAAIPAEGRLLLRVGDSAAGLGYRASCWVDRIVAGARRGETSLIGRPAREWRAMVEACGLSVEAVSAHGRTPFANVLLVGTRAQTAAGRATETDPWSRT